MIASTRLGMTCCEVFQRFTLARTAPALGQTDHAVEAGDLGETVAARGLEAVHATHAEPEEPHGLAPVRCPRPLPPDPGGARRRRGSNIAPPSAWSTSVPRSRPGNGSTTHTVIDHTDERRSAMSSKSGRSPKMSGDHESHRASSSSPPTRDLASIRTARSIRIGRDDRQDDRRRNEPREPVVAVATEPVWLVWRMDEPPLPPRPRRISSNATDGLLDEGNCWSRRSRSHGCAASTDAAPTCRRPTRPSRQPSP